MHHATSAASRGAGPAPESSHLTPASHVLSWTARQLAILASDLSEVPVRDRGGVDGGWREALEALYETIAAVETLDVRDAYAALELCRSTFGRCEVLRVDMLRSVFATVGRLVVELDAAEDAVLADARVRAEAERRVRSWANGGGPVLRGMAVSR